MGILYFFFELYNFLVDDDAFFTIPIASLIILVTISFIFIINNYISHKIAIDFFLVIFVFLIIFTDTPYELLNGRSIVYFIIPIIIGSIFFKPKYEIFITILIIGIIALLSLINSIMPNIPTIFIYLLIGGLMAFSSNSIQNAIINTKRAYDRIDLYKDIFSHDISNIIQIIKSSTQILPLMMEKNENKNEIISIIENLDEQTERATRLISNIRKLSQLEEKISLKKIDALPFLNASIEYIKNSHHNKTVKINLDVQVEQVYIEGNELISDIFENLLNNAIFHNKKHELFIDIKIIEEIKNKIHYYKFQFIDNGIGIRDDLKEKIFLRTTENITHHLGFGLGLSLIKNIIELFKGNIWVKNRIKNDYTKGSNFILIFPKKKE
ncbi:MAG: HAMP domain-containing histidine kinase [Candidatus Lokiarchaeota archaeon]|nr:HAMP domain-containing histidine kinase [Candidatus Lokiarchaeota archaeon]